MNCPKCNGKTKVIDSRTSRTKKQGYNVPVSCVFRTRCCSKCSHRFNTLEGIINDNY